MFIESNSINIFPLSKPRSTMNSRLFYEENVANLIRQLVDTESFIIKSPEKLDGITLREDLVFNIYGYYFKINAGVTFPNEDGNYIIGKITLDIQEGIPVEISGQDVNNKYEGLEIMTATELPKNTPTEKYIVLFNRSSDYQWVTNKSAYVKFQSQSFTISGIDGKR